MKPSLDIVIVNWNTGPELAACLRSIVGAVDDGVALRRVVVVDNASHDASLEGIEQLPLPLTIVRNEANRGFAVACNQGARGSVADYLLFLNPDTLLSRDALRVPVAFLSDEANAAVGICGIRLVDEAGAPTTTHARFPSVQIFLGQVTGLSRLWPRAFPPHLLHAHPGGGTSDVDQVIGAFFLVRRKVYDALGGFDERFFVYFEEVDFSLRAKRLGYRSVCLTDVTSLHMGGLSSDQVRAHRLFYSLRSRLQYAAKHFSRTDRLMVLALTWILELPIRVARALISGSVSAVAETVSAYGMLLGFGQRSGGISMRRQRS